MFRPISNLVLVPPEMKVVPHLPNRHHPVSWYEPRLRKISFSKAELSKVSSEARRFAVLHELGHWWRCEYMRPVDFKVLGGKPNEENLCDAFAFYFLDLEQGQIADESFRDFLKELLREDHENIKKIANEICEQLERKFR